MRTTCNFVALSAGMIAVGVLACAAMAQSPAPPAFSTVNVYHAPTAAEALHGNRDNLVVGVHGWTSYPSLWWLDGTNSWNNPNGTPPNPGMRTSLVNALGANANNWDLWGLDWTEGAKDLSQYIAASYPQTYNEINAQLQGQYLAKMIAVENYKNVHLMGHSLGGRVIETATTILKQVRPSINVQETFFDAYRPYGWEKVFGSMANYADQYYTTQDMYSGWRTAGIIPSALNVNMDSQVPPRPADYNFNSNYNDEYWQHNSPHFWYKASSRNPTAAVYGGFAYGLSKESGNNNPASNLKYASGQSVTLAADGSSTSVPVNPVVLVPGSLQSVNTIVGGDTGSHGATYPIDDSTVMLTATGNGADAVGYIDFPLQLTSPVNYFQFDFHWLETAGNGRFTFDLFQPGSGGGNSLLWASDSAYGFDQTLSTGKIMWTGASGGLNDIGGVPLAAGDYELRFRLDTLTRQQTQIEISNITAGLIATPEPSSMFVAAFGILTLVMRKPRPNSMATMRRGRVKENRG